jgi:C1A family cysteine protease
MRLLSALFVGAASAQFARLSFTTFTDRECKEGSNTTFEPLNTCIKEQRPNHYRRITCADDGKSGTDIEYSDECQTQIGNPHRFQTDTCLSVGGARGSFQMACVRGEESQESQANDFEAWTTRHEKVYATSAEYEKRAGIFKANLLKAQIRNLESIQNGGDAVHGVTQFSDLTEEEFRNTYLMPNYVPVEDDRFVETSLEVAADVDWRTKGVLTRVKDQGQCGSCWAFSATEAIESYAMLSNKYPLHELSPQQINSCDKTDGGCNGGNTESAYMYVVRAGGIETEQSYPYTSGSGRTGTCMADTTKFVVKVAGYKAVARGEPSLETALNNGPVSVCLAADAFQTYRGGILASCPGQIDHCVQAVGYTADYWIIRNSWGANWGEAGFLRLKRGSNLCHVSDDVTYPTF